MFFWVILCRAGPFEQNNLVMGMFNVFSLYFQTAGPFEERGMVMGVLDKAFDVFIMKFGVIKRVYCDVRYFCTVSEMLGCIMV